VSWRWVVRRSSMEMATRNVAAGVAAVIRPHVVGWAWSRLAARLRTTPPLRTSVGHDSNAPPDLAVARLLPHETDQARRVDDLADPDLRLAGHAHVDQLDPAGRVGRGQAHLVHGLPVAVGLDLAGVLADQPRPWLGDAYERQPRGVDGDGDIAHDGTPLVCPLRGGVMDERRHPGRQAR